MGSRVRFIPFLGILLLMTGCTKETIDKTSSVVSPALISELLNGETIHDLVQESVLQALNVQSDFLQNLEPGLSEDTTYIHISEEDGKGLIAIEDYNTNSIACVFSYTYKGSELTSFNLVSYNTIAYNLKEPIIKDLQEKEMREVERN